jgi:hypothetical protein
VSTGTQRLAGPEILLKIFWAHEHMPPPRPATPRTQTPTGKQIHMTDRPRLSRPENQANAARVVARVANDLQDGLDRHDADVYNQSFAATKP